MARLPTCNGWSPDNVMLQILTPFHWASRSSPTWTASSVDPGVLWHEKVGKYSLGERIPCEANPLVPMSCTPHNNLGVGPWRSSIMAFSCAAPHGQPALLLAKSLGEVSPSLPPSTCSKAALRTRKCPSSAPSFSPFSSSPGEDQLVAHLQQMLMQVNTQPDIIGHIKASKERRKEARVGKQTTKKQPCLQKNRIQASGWPGVLLLSSLFSISNNNPKMLTGSLC